MSAPAPATAANVVTAVKVKPGRGRIHPHSVMPRRSLVLMIALPVSVGRLRGG